MIEATLNAPGRYRVFDGDNHYYESYDSFTRHIDPAWADWAIHVERAENGRNYVMVGNERLRSNSVHPQDFIAPPESILEMFRDPNADMGMAEFNVRNRMRAEELPDSIDVGKRLEFMDREGIDAAMLYPSLAVMIEQQLASNIGATYANLHAFNRWLEDDWGYATENRLFSVPLLSLLDLDEAVKELDRVLRLGARAVHLRTGPVFGRSPASEHFDPFWARLNEARVPVAFHSSFSQYHQLVSVHWGEKGDPTYTEITPMQSYLGTGARPMMDTMAALTFHGLFTRFPKVNVMAVEGGSFWVADLFKQMDKAYQSGRGSKLAPKLHDLPSAILKQHLYVTPFPEEDVTQLAAVLPTDHIILGSDYPHPEGLAHPATYANKIEPVLGEAATRGVMGENLARVIGIWN
ncbi:amidohydrolase [Novosphingobium sp. G106]|uniref:amidohydrolase family protein n=1 Tax=Novosphingobium sp. G106 TaxID=2849500 RepID=UPI001C2DEE11|nr:amidohydrolase family protein [Novosphingobium sp. G106]MBV1689714.1 amidohydrolase [Novosphingobium sp. G106]